MLIYLLSESQTQNKSGTLDVNELKLYHHRQLAAFREQREYNFFPKYTYMLPEDKHASGKTGVLRMTVNIRKLTSSCGYI